MSNYPTEAATHATVASGGGQYAQEPTTQSTTGSGTTPPSTNPREDSSINPGTAHGTGASLDPHQSDVTFANSESTGGPPSTVGTDKTYNPPSGGDPAPVDDTVPKQHHAGKVGYGPNYRQGPGMSDKISGLKEEIKGKVTKKPELVQHGRDLRTGELKRREEDVQNNGAPESNLGHSSESGGVYTGEKVDGKRQGEGSIDIGA